MKLRAGKIIEIFEVAGTTERLMPGLKKPITPKMYDILKMSHDPKDLGFWQKKGLKLRANSKQITCWELAIDLLVKAKPNDRKLIWKRARRYSWVALARMFGCHRVTIKRRYTRAILDLEFNLDKSLIDIIDKI
tara:strand:+ start:970 stop:1371 length:402 start_codon:yes stop_codon:yes gene_type:complete